MSFSSFLKRAISCFSASRSPATRSRSASSSRSACSSDTCLAKIIASSAMRCASSCSCAAAMDDPKIAANSSLSNSRSPFSSHFENISTSWFWSTFPSPNPNVRARAGSRFTPRIISRTEIVPLPSLSRYANICVSAFLSPFRASDATSLAPSKWRSGEGPLFAFSASDSEPAFSSLAFSSGLSPLAIKTPLITPLANLAISKSSAISP